jgi:hypothetical protein
MSRAKMSFWPWHIQRLSGTNQELPSPPTGAPWTPIFSF